MKYMKYILIVSYFFLLGCLSEEEIAARQENAFDISGTYKTTENSEVQLNFKITNQEEKHDIFIKLERTSPLSNKEKTLFSTLSKEHGISEKTLTKNLSSFILGKIHLLFQLDGGDNYSDDFGATSKFYVCSKAMEYNSKKVKEGEKNITLEIEYCLSGVIKKENKNLIEGKLILDPSYFFNLDGVDHVIYKQYDELELNYKALKLL